MMIRVLILLVLLAARASLAQAQSLDIYTEEDPPYSFQAKDGSLSGAGVEIVRAIQKRIANDDRILLVPWARAYFNIQRYPNVVVFTMSRTRDRDKRFQWVGPILENNWVILAKKGSGLQLKTLDEAMKLKSIGVVRGYAWTEYLQNKNFSNLALAVSHRSNAKMLHSGRIQSMVSTDVTYASVFTAEQLDPKDFEVILNFRKVQMYIAHSKDTPAAVVARWQTGYAQIKADGTLLRILQKWLPHATLPEPGPPLE